MLSLIVLWDIVYNRLHIIRTYNSCKRTWTYVTLSCSLVQIWDNQLKKCFTSQSMPSTKTQASLPEFEQCSILQHKPRQEYLSRTLYLSDQPFNRHWLMSSCDFAPTQWHSLLKSAKCFKLFSWPKMSVIYMILCEDPTWMLLWRTINWHVSCLGCRPPLQPMWL